ncbi:MAG: hypothetical protein WBB82_14655, partial [Limnothrix sp.]
VESSVIGIFGKAKTTVETFGIADDQNGSCFELFLHYSKLSLLKKIAESINLHRFQQFFCFKTLS